MNMLYARVENSGWSGPIRQMWRQLLADGWLQASPASSSPLEIGWPKVWSEIGHSTRGDEGLAL